MDNPAYLPEQEIESGAHKNGKSPQHIVVHTIEKAIELTTIGRFHYMLLFICGICFMSVMSETMGISMIIPLVKCDLKPTQTEQGLLVSAGFFGIVVSSHMMGFLADTCGRARTLRYSLILATCATIISAFSVNTWMLLVFRFLNGFFISGCQACVFSLCGEFHSNKTRTRYVTFLVIFLPLALLYLPAIGFAILPLTLDFKIFGLTFVSWRVFLITNILLSIIGLLGLYTLPETPKYMLIQGDHDKALETLRKIYLVNTGKTPESYPVKQLALETSGSNLANIHGIKDAIKLIWDQTAPLFYKKRILHTLNICFSLMAIYGIAQGAFMWYPTILSELIAKKGQGLSVCAIIGNMEHTETSIACNGSLDTFIFKVLMGNGAVFTVVYLLFSYTVDIIGKVNLLMIWLVVCCSCSVIIHWTSELEVSVIVLTFLLSIGNCGGLVSAVAVDFFPTYINAMGMCFVMMLGRLGAVAGGNIIGFLLFKQCDILFWAFSGIIALLIALAAVLPERKRERREESDITI